MWKHLQLLMSIFSFMSFTTDPGKNDPKDPPVDDPENPKDTKDPKGDELPDDKSKWTVEQWNAEVQRVAKKEKDEGRKAAEREAQQKQADADAAADLEKQESQGEYETAKTQLTSDRDQAVEARDQALALLKVNVDTQWDEMPESVKSTYTGDKDDVLAKSAYMQQMKPIITELAEKEKSQKAGGNPKNPKAASAGQTEIPSAVPKRRMW